MRDLAAIPTQFGAPESARFKYSALVVGRPGWATLLTYELVMLCSQWVPGAVRLALRTTLYPRLFGACGRGVNREVFSGSLGRLGPDHRSGGRGVQYG